MFWDLRTHPSTTPCIIDGANHRRYSYGELMEATTAAQRDVKSDAKSLVLLSCDNSFVSVVYYLALLQTHQAAILVHRDIDIALLQTLVGIYEPDLLVLPRNTPPTFGPYEPKDSAFGEVALFEKKTRHPVLIHPGTAILLSTSGTTGSPKMVRLSKKNLQANAESIAAYLGLTPGERPITTLPLHYSYGLSVMNSHLHAGAAVVLTNLSVLQKEFWDLFRKNECTSFAGVPFTYQMLERLHFEKMDLPTLRTITQAGGRLSVERIAHFEKIARERRMKFFVMYGQTEATARISYVPPEELHRKIGSIGKAIPGGVLSIEDEGKRRAEPFGEGEIVYTGPNVMLGYAESRADLGRGDELNGVLHTGDLGHQDEDGYFFVTGRLKRFIKVFGLRLNLDEVERMLEAFVASPFACFGSDDDLLVAVETSDVELLKRIKQHIIDLYHLHHSVVTVFQVSSIPLNSSGKKDYNRLKTEFSNVRD